MQKNIFGRSEKFPFLSTLARSSAVQVMILTHGRETNYIESEINWENRVIVFTHLFLYADDDVFLVE